jgi:cytochrome P450
MTKIHTPLPGSDASPWREIVPTFFKKGILGTFTYYSEKYGPCYRLKLPFNNEVFVLSHPDAVQHILRDNIDNYPKGTIYDGARLLLGNGLVTSEGELWKKNRKLCQPSFNNAHISRYLIAMTHSVDKLIAQWHQKAGQTIDLQQTMNDLTLEIVGATLFGQDLSHQSRQAGKAFSIALKGIGSRGPGNLAIPLWLPTLGNIRFYLARKQLKKLVKDIIDNFRKNKQKQTEDCLLGSLMHAKDDNGQGLSDQQLIY